MAYEQTWRDVVKERLKEVYAQLPADASPAEVKREVREAYPFGLRQYYPYKVWLDESKKWFYNRFPDQRPPDLEPEKLSESARLELIGQQRLF